MIKLKSLTFTVISAVIIIFLVKCNTIQSNSKHDENFSTNQLPKYFDDSKPYTRWWWFASEIKKEDIISDLNWLKSNNFGGVEIAWVYPLNRLQGDTVNYTPRQEWLSSDWSEIVSFAKHYADSINMGCDFTFGTLWPFGDTKVPEEEASQVYSTDIRLQEISRSWEYPKTGYVIDHLNKQAFNNYAKRMGDALKPALLGNPSSIFVDSWEVESKYIWTTGFDEKFEAMYGYSIMPYLTDLYHPDNKEVLYDYMKLTSELIIENFYRPFNDKAHELGAFSRAQCSGAPCDILSAYATVDIPESEAMLYEPSYSIIPASAAALSNKPVVSSETFTCIYGWPGYYIGEEQTADLKMVADALFANGVNQIFWHGKPLNPAGYDSVKFYATVHVGSSGMLASELAQFNNYLSDVSSYMKKGITYSKLAVYIPLEDSWHAGELPKEQQFIWAWGDYEFRYRYIPEYLKSYRPLWINQEFLEKAKYKDGRLIVAGQSFQALFVDSEYLDLNAVTIMIERMNEGLPVIFSRIPKQAGLIKDPQFEKLLGDMLNHKNGYRNINEVPDNLPLIEGENIPDFWCRKEDDSWFFFFANPSSHNLKFPISYGQSLTSDSVNLDITLNIEGKQLRHTLIFEPYKSVLIKVEQNKIIPVKLNFTPSIPVKKSLEINGNAPWKVQ